MQINKPPLKRRNKYFIMKYSTHMCKYNKYISLKNNYEINTCVPTIQLRHWDVTNIYEALFLPDCTLSLTTELVLVSPSRDNHYHDFCDLCPLTYNLTTHVYIP